jgi:tRNA U34 5-methylaminomethyl-2-thiouridine-forming methyltransferase MnmC
MPDQIQIITTGDGSHSLLNSALNETYHSVHGARRESVHVFIKNGLEYFLEKNQVEVAKIFEVGFGTGLNALLTASFAEDHRQKISYTSIEAYPLSSDITSQLNYADTESEKIIFHKLHTGSWENENLINDYFTLKKIRNRLEEIQLAKNGFNVIFFDAFAPSKQPELWELPILEKVCRLLQMGGVFVTYCAKGQLKRDLQKLGLEVQTLPGPPGKKEMVRALKIS